MQICCEVESRPITVVAVTSIIQGDYPAKMAVAGLKSHQSRFLCHICCIKKTEMKGFMKEKQLPALYSNSLFRSEWEARNHALTGTDVDADIMALRASSNRKAVIFSWPGVELSTLGVDLMHLMLKGVLCDVFEAYCVCGALNDKLMLVSDLFKAYCRANCISGFEPFASLESFKKLKANAHLLKHFAFAFVLFFDEIGVDVRFAEETGLLKDTCRLVYQLCAFELSEDQLLHLENLLASTASKLAEKVGFGHKPNHHMAMHWITAIRRHGVPRAHWVFPHESRNANIKAEFSNLNGREMDATIFHRLTIAFILANNVTPSRYASFFHAERSTFWHRWTWTLLRSKLHQIASW